MDKKTILFKLLYKIGLYPDEVTDTFIGNKFKCILPYVRYDIYLDGRMLWSGATATNNDNYEMWTVNDGKHTITLKDVG